MPCFFARCLLILLRRTCIRVKSGAALLSLRPGRGNMQTRFLGRPLRRTPSLWRGTTVPKTDSQLVSHLIRASQQRKTWCFIVLIIYGLALVNLTYLFATVYPKVVHVTRAEYYYEMTNNTTTIIPEVTTKLSILNATRLSTVASDVNITTLKTNTTPNVSNPKVVNPHPFRFVIANKDACTGENSDVFLVVLVKCRVAETFDREFIRRTWGGVQNVLGRKMRTMFLTGQPTDSSKNKLMQDEDQKYHDIIQEDFMDSYFNLTYKTLMGWRWVSTYCPTASYVISIDSDMILNPRNLILRLEKVPRKQFSEGNRRVNVAPMRSRSSKWFIPKKLYPHATYPPFLNGGCYVMSTDIAMRLYETSFRVPFFKLDDVYNGMVMAAMNFSSSYSDLYQQYTSVEIGLKRGVAVGAIHVKSINNNYFALWDRIVGSELKKDQEQKHQKEEDNAKKETGEIETDKEQSDPGEERR